MGQGIGVLDSGLTIYNGLCDAITLVVLVDNPKNDKFLFIADLAKFVEV